MRDDLKIHVQVGTVVQLNQNAPPGDGSYAGEFMVVTDPKSWGAEGYVTRPIGSGVLPEKIKYKAQWKDMEYIGNAVFYARSVE